MVDISFVRNSSTTSRITFLALISLITLIALLFVYGDSPSQEILSSNVFIPTNQTSNLRLGDQSTTDAYSLESVIEDLSADKQLSTNNEETENPAIDEELSTNIDEKEAGMDEQISTNSYETGVPEAKEQLSTNTDETIDPATNEQLSTNNDKTDDSVIGSDSSALYEEQQWPKEESSNKNNLETLPFVSKRKLPPETTCNIDPPGYTKEQSDFIFKTKEHFKNCSEGKQNFMEVKDNHLILNCDKNPKYALGIDSSQEHLSQSISAIPWNTYSTEVNFENKEYAFGKCNDKTQAVYVQRPKKSASERAKKITQELSSNEKPRPLTVFLVVFDSVSRQHFYRSFPKTVEFLNESLVTGNYSQEIVAYDFLINNAHGTNSAPNVIPLMYGQDIQAYEKLTKGLSYSKSTDQEKFKKIQEKAMWKWYEEHGFVTMFGYDTAFEYLTKSLGKYIDVDHTASSFWKASKNLFGYNEFHRYQICFGMKDAHRYLLDYTMQFMKNYQGLNKFAYIHMSPGHEETGTVIRTADPNVKEYLKEMFDYIVERKDEDFAIMLLSDHGKHVIDFDWSLAGYKENVLPVHIMFANQRLIQSLGADEILKHNTNTLTSRMDWYLTLKHLATVPYSTIHPDSKDYKEWKNEIDAKSAHSLLIEKNQGDRTCDMLGIPSHLCSCNAFEEVDLAKGLKFKITSKIANQGIHHINQAVQSFEYLCQKVTRDSITSISKQDMLVKYESKGGIKEARNTNYKIRLFTEPEAIYEVFSLVAKKEDFEKFKKDTRSGAYPIDSAKHKIDGNSEHVEIQLKQIIRVDAYRGICEELALLAGVPAPLCICTQPYNLSLKDLKSNSSLTSLYETLLAKLDIIVGEEKSSCESVCKKSNMSCREWGLQLIDNVHVLKQSWLSKSMFDVNVDGMNKSFREFDIKKEDVGKFIGIKGSTLYLADPDDLDCDFVGEDIRPICACGY